MLTMIDKIWPNNKKILIRNKVTTKGKAYSDN